MFGGKIELSRHLARLIGEKIPHWVSGLIKASGIWKPVLYRKQNYIRELRAEGFFSQYMLRHYRSYMLFCIF